MKLHLIAVACIAVSVGPAAAQSNTTCYRYGNMTQCQSGGGMDPNLPLQAAKGVFTLDDILNDAQQRQQRQQQMQIQQQQMYLQQQAADQARSAAEAQQSSAHLSQVVHDGVGEYLQQGKCDDAISLALKYGEIDLAMQARQFCAASPVANPVSAPAAPVGQPEVPAAPAPIPHPSATTADQSMREVQQGNDVIGPHVHCDTCRER